VQFRSADTFTDSLAKLAGDEQKAVKITTFDLQANPARSIPVYAFTSWTVPKTSASNRFG